MFITQHLNRKIENDLSIEGIFDSAYFWDIEPKDVFVRRDAEFIINRMFKWCEFPGELDILEKHYSYEEIRKHAVKCKFIHDRESFNILSSRYQIPKNEFLYCEAFK